MWKNRVLGFLDLAGLAILQPVVRLACGDEPRQQLSELARQVVAPIVAFSLFIALWWLAARNVETRHGSLPTPPQVWSQGVSLVEGHFESRARRKQFEQQRRDEAAELDRLAAAAVERARGTDEPSQRSKLLGLAERLRTDAALARGRRFSSPPTYLDQIGTSLTTVFTGFVLASLVAVPLGMLCGMSRTFLAAVNPLIQVFKPVSPLAWLPLVMIVVGAVYTVDPRDAWFEKSFLSSAITVALCSLWPTLVNTALGVATIDKDYLNVARVLRLNGWTRLTKIVIPASLPLVFAGLRISLSVGWMVLIAAEMLSQNPGLGKFVWDVFQNGSRQSLAQIVVAVFTIGIVGFFLDRVMVVLQKSVSYEPLST